MHSLTLTLATLVLPLLTSASPLAARQAAAPTIPVTFLGATPEAQYTVWVPETGAWVPTNNVLSVSHISVPGGTSEPCTFFGVDGAVVNLPVGGGQVDVGPPQTIAGGVCGPFPGQAYGMW